MSNSQVKRAHIIPKSYMLPWADENGDIYVADAQNGRALILRASNATIVKYAYKAAVLKHDREAHYSQIETRGIRAIRAACSGAELNQSDRRDLTDFMDMFIERGLYADQNDLSVSVIRGSFDSDEFEEVEFNLGDMISLHKDLNASDVTLRDAGIENWNWAVVEQPHPMMTGDGAVICIKLDEQLTTVLFPLSPFKLLIVGEAQPDLSFSVTKYIASVSRRWIIGRPQDAPEWVLSNDKQNRTRKQRNSG